MNDSSILDAALSEWQRWRCPEKGPPGLKEALKATALPGTGSTFLLALGGRKLVLKTLPATGFARQSPARSKKLDMLQQRCAAAGLAPAPVYRCPKGKYLVLEYVEGVSLAEAPHMMPAVLHDVLAALRECHAIDPPGLPPLDYLERCESYLAFAKKTLDHARYASYRLQLMEIKDHIHDWTHNSRTRKVFCHHDLHPGNILVTESKRNGHRICFIDWDFCNTGIAELDYASLCTEFSLDLNNTGAGAGFDDASMSAASALYRFWCEIYNECIAGAAGTPGAYESAL